MSATAAEHLVEVARCPILERCLDEVAPTHPCSAIVLDQWKGLSAEERIARWRAAHQLPEPWDGHLETAPILFLSSNPSISGSVHSQRPAALEREPPSEYLGRTAAEHPSIRRLGQGPRWEWADEEIVDRYESAFDLYIADGVAGLLPDGGRAPATRFWVEVRSRARELIPGREVRPGVDYALTEAVRCKSRGEHGVAEAVNTCSARYLRRTLELSAAVVVVVLGRVAGGAVEQQLGVSRSRPVHERVLVDGRPRWIAFLPHPNARTARTFAANIGEEALGRMQRVVAEAL